MTNLEKFKQEILDDLDNTDLYDSLFSLFMEHNNIYPESGKDLINWLSEDYKEPILTSMEKSYLLNIINPIKDRVHWIELHRYYKTECDAINKDSRLDWLEIRYDDLRDDGLQIITVSDALYLPSFEHRTQFCGMVYDHQYSLNELGL